MIAHLFALSETRNVQLAFLFRFYICFYACAVLFIFPHTYNITAFVIFLLISALYLFLSFFSNTLGINKFRWINLILDTLYVGVIFYWCGKYDTISLMLALLPLFANVCLSDLHFSKWLALSIPITLWGILTLQQIPFDFISLCSPFYIVGIIVILSEIPMRIQLKMVRLSDMIDSFFTMKDNVQNSYRIYDKIIEILNSKPIPITIDGIYCFLNINGLYLYNGSKYVWSYELENVNLSVEPLMQEKIRLHKHMTLILNGQEIKKCQGYEVIINDGVTYLFVIVAENVSTFTKMFLNITFKTLSVKLAKLYESERLQKTFETDKMMFLSQKANYVNAAVSSLHFIRNKLSPMKTFFDIVDDLKMEQDPARKEKIRQYLMRDIDKMKDSFNLMIERANYLLDDSETPFIYTSTHRYTLMELFTEIRSHWQGYHLDESVISISLLETSEGEGCYLSYNKEGLGLVFDNWISNIRKYSVKSYSLGLKENENNVTILFTNDYDPKKGLNFVRCYSLNDRAEINKNKWHGLNNIKSFLSQMNIQGEMNFDEKNIYFKITFAKVYDNEKSTDN